MSGFVAGLGLFFPYREAKMANWYYYDESGEKIGPVTGRELKQLAQNGTIVRETFVEDPSGRTGLAKDVSGLVFPETPQPEPLMSIRLVA